MNITITPEQKDEICKCLLEGFVDALKKNNLLSDHYGEKDKSEIIYQTLVGLNFKLITSLKGWADKSDKLQRIIIGDYFKQMAKITISCLEEIKNVKK